MGRERRQGVRARAERVGKRSGVAYAVAGVRAYGEQDIVVERTA
jgi:hypothetical protein